MMNVRFKGAERELCFQFFKFNSQNNCLRVCVEILRPSSTYLISIRTIASLFLNKFSLKLYSLGPVKAT